MATPQGTLSALVVFDGLRTKELQGDGTLELGVLGLIDHPHPAFAELRGGPVPADRRADPNDSILTRFSHRVARQGA